MQKAALLTQHLNLTPIVTLQPQYNLLAREIEFEVVPVCENEGIGILPWSPLGGGWLTGKYQRDSTPTGATRLGENPQRGVEAYAGRNAEERTWRVLDAVRQIAGERGVSMSAVALAWLTGRPAVTSVILGARTTEQLDDNLTAGDLVLDAEQMRLLDEASDPPVGDYPYGGAGCGSAPGPAERVMTSFPEPTDPAGSRTEVFLRYLDYFRDSVVAKVSALDESELRRSRLPSGWTPLELLTHLRHVELRWIEWGFQGRDVAEPWGDRREDRWYVAPTRPARTWWRRFGRRARTPPRW
ncbi:aldo/keto reductase [Micromonospora sp. M12]